MSSVSGIQASQVMPSQHKASNSAADTGKVFANMLGNAMNQVNQSQIQAQQSAQNLTNGSETNLHNVMISAQKAEITLTAAVEIRNKVINAYQSIMRMQI